MEIIHHGAVNGVTGSCHQLKVSESESLLVDCGLFQGLEARQELGIEFDISTVRALLVTHCHIDHVGRIPYLLAAGFTGPIYASEATAALLPLVIEDALKLGVTEDEQLVATCLRLIRQQLVPIAFKQWQALKYFKTPVRFRLQRAGHILGSAYIEVDVGQGKQAQRMVFSGDLGAPHTPLLPAPKPPYKADTLVIESTYGDTLHQGRKNRSKRLKEVIEKAVRDNGVVLIPAFSIGRTQELLYELEQIIHSAPRRSFWRDIEVIIDSPMAANFTSEYRHFKSLWDKEAKARVAKGRHPLNFEHLYTLDSHQEHVQTLSYLKQRQKPAIVIAASGMCSGGRIVNYLEAFLGDPRTDVIFVGYQGQGTPGRDIQKYGQRGGYVVLNKQRIDIKAQIHTISGYSAHADQANLVRFVSGMTKKPEHIKIVHGDTEAKQALADKLKESLKGEVKIEIAT
ncbi:MBL fold metallo-hydrolase RNA specificity domain-containing protein [Pseudoalteromonas sp. T1lg10]|uniref:MBL fold metallo-hydrolase RNA specificity domain-containing protein n=1 Tax=Pseudoalteromonas sp. T1lg10 TaxID=2077093 RepID=UPI000CF65C3A|nr:MBL fold metallo-hydrolase [Pseudoalteromonas sp. T1lg10]